MWLTGTFAQKRFDIHNTGHRISHEDHMITRELKCNNQCTFVKLKQKKIIEQ